MLDLFGLVETKASAIRVGEVFGRLAVVAVGQVAGTYRYYAVCRCACGSELKKIRQDGLKCGAVVSCGCVQKERTTTHGMTKSIHYDRWKNMIDRCFNKKCHAYNNYGGRGISVCDRWLDIKNFVSDLPDGYFDGAEIDRIDNDGNYEPGNVRWSSQRENCDNRRSGRMLSVNGKTQSLRRWAEEVGVDERLIWSRIEELNWDIETAVLSPVMPTKEVVKKANLARWGGHTTKGRPKPKTSRRYRTVEYKSEFVTIKQLSAMTGITSKRLWSRIFERGWPVEKAVVK